MTNRPNPVTYEPRPLPAPTTTLRGTCQFVDSGKQVHYEVEVVGHLPVLLGQGYTLVPPSNGWEQRMEAWLTPTLRRASVDVLNNHLLLELGPTEAIDDLPFDIDDFQSMLRAEGWFVAETSLGSAA